VRLLKIKVGILSRINYVLLRIPKPKTNVSCGNDSRSAIKPGSLRQDEDEERRERDENKLKIQLGESGRAARFLSGGWKGEPMGTSGALFDPTIRRRLVFMRCGLRFRGPSRARLSAGVNARRQIVPAYATRLAGFPPRISQSDATSHAKTRGSTPPI
jgi:hypothetical protein